MSEIPADVMKTARRVAIAVLDACKFSSSGNVAEPIALAILAERERCAKACEFRADALAKIKGYRSEVTELRSRAVFIRSGE